ncbi:MAG TPA: GNAT family N-acetyltransferase [Stellaceae bacterium]
MSWRIAPITGGSRELLLATPLSMLHRACFPEDPWDIRAMTDILRLPGCFGAVAWSIAEPVGFALALALGEESEILALGVVPARRRAGIGAALLEAICDAARRCDARSVVLEVAADNTGARALYAGRGFVPIGRRPDYYRRGQLPIDALVLRLDLFASSGTT